MQQIIINGFGRIGRLVLRALLERKQKYKIIVNDPSPIELLLHLLKYDSVHKPPVSTDLSNVKFTHNMTPSYHESVDMVLECSGQFTTLEKASSHIRSGAQKVLISAPSKDPELTVVYGVNHKEIKPTHKIISNGSCTTNCVTPLLHILDQEFGVTACHFTTVHAYTATQNLVDGANHDLRKARAAALSMVPATTGASEAVYQILPHIKLTGASIRVPVANVSLVDIIFETTKPVSQDHIHEAMKKAALGSMKGIMLYNEDEIVSIDCNHTPYSAIFDSTLTQVVHSHMAKISAFYDNEWGFANRMVDTMQYWLNL